MKLTRVICLCCFASVLGFAGSWSGALVDSKCYATMRGNVNPHETSLASSDQSYPIRYCSPSVKTKAFAVVQQDGATFDLDPAGNGKVIALLSQTAKRPVYVVNVTGEISRNVVTVDAISMAK